MTGYVHGKMIKRLESLDGSRRVEVVARDDGMFQTYAYKYMQQEKGWGDIRISGLFDDAEAAEREAAHLVR